MGLRTETPTTEPTQARAGLDIGALTVGGIAAIATGVIVRLALRHGAEADFQAHVALTAAGLRGGHFPGDVLFYWLDAALAGFQPVERRLFRGLIVILAVATGVKVFLTVRFVGAEYLAATKRRVPRYGIVLAGLCTLAYGPPIGMRYPAFIPPNVWHNSTTTLLMPLALGLYLSSLAYLRTASRRLLVVLLVLVALNVAAKPSFMLCWLVVFPIAVLLRDRRRFALFGAVLVGTAGAVLLAAQYAYIYILSHGDPAATPSGIRLAPLHIWSAYANNIPLSLFIGYAFPILALLLCAPVRQSLAVRFALGLSVVGLVWFALLTETGVREYHGNFMWQAIVTNYLLFAAVLSAVLPWLYRGAFGLRQTAVLLAFGLHVLGGAVFLYQWINGTY